VTGFCEIVKNFGFINNWQFIDYCVSLSGSGWQGKHTLA